jgi:2-polyprenyl-3-methyl-5-hydroxy-6-metoxy-1,4-benzoquinol methylase
MPRAAQYFPSESELSDDSGIDLGVYQCASCGLVQLNSEPVWYFKEVITATSFSEETRKIRLGQMTEFVKKFNFSGKTMLEVGSGKGEMLDILEEAGINATGMEASKEAVEEGRAKGRRMIEGYIDDDHIDLSGNLYDGFVCFNFLEHVPDPASVIRKIYNNTTQDAVGFVTVPNLTYLLETKCHYEFVADHLSYFTESTLCFAFESNGFDVIDCRVINNDNDVSIFIKKKTALDLSGDFLETENLCLKLTELIATYTGQKKKVAVWGAGHRTLALLALGQVEDIEYVVDSAIFKQGKYTPVLHREIVSPEALVNRPVDLILVMVPGIYPDEVVSTIEQMGIGSDVAVLRNHEVQMLP